MDTVLILIASPADTSISKKLIEECIEILPDAGDVVWLAENEACEISISAAHDQYSNIEDRLRDIVADQKIDLAILPAGSRRKKLLIADMDSTMIHEECIDELGEAAGAGDAIREITKVAMRGDLDFEGALRERVAKMKGLPEAVIGDVLQNNITLRAGGKTLVQTMKAQGAFTALCSGGFVQFTSEIARKLGFDYNNANRLIIEDGVLTGFAEEPILGKDAKVAELNRMTNEQGLSANDVLAVGDGANDIPMLQKAGLGIALHGKPSVREAADIRIDHADLTALLYLQGYRKAEFVI